MAVLLLDSTYEPLGIIDWMDAISKVVTGEAEIVEEADSGEEIRSEYITYKMPSVIRQFAKFRKQGEVKFSRLNIYLRDNFTCQYCGDKKKTSELTFDHVLPRYQGGITSWTNIVAACRPCNHDKRNRTPEQAGMPLKKKPIKPKWLPSGMILRMKSMPKQWEPYVDLASTVYWTEELETG